VLGAAVWPGGQPSPALRRRVAAALRAERAAPGARFLVTGAVGRHPPSEARVMRALLVEAGIAPERVVLEESGRDTVSSLVACARIVRGAGPIGSITLCSDDYHLPRCRAVLRALGLRARGAPAQTSGRDGSLGHRLGRRLRETLALPGDVVLAWVQRMQGRVR